jgi:predicted phage terminase large subunit-like protein
MNNYSGYPPVSQSKRYFRDETALRAAALLELRNREKKHEHLSFLDYAQRVNPKYQRYPHVERLAETLDRVISGELKRVMIFLPPRHSKSESVSRIFPSYALYKDPHHMIGLCSYSAQLAEGFSRIARDNFVRGGGLLKQDSKSIKEWHTEDGGMLWAAGVGGPITGKGFTIGIIDDPIKNAEEAESMFYRQKIKEWYDSTFLTREEPDAAIVYVATRWHEDDLAGYILEKESDEPQYWHIVYMPAIREDVRPEYPSTCTVETDDRAVGEALCPERYDIHKLESIRATVGRYWVPLYQQRPSAASGDIWRKEWFKKITGEQLKTVTLQDRGLDWDLAYTRDEENSANAYIDSAKDVSGNIYILDAGFEWLEFPPLIRWMLSFALPHYVEKKASGKSAAQTLRASGVYAQEVDVVAIDKIARAKLASPVAENGQVYVLDTVLDKLLNDTRQGILFFPKGKHDDVNDALVQAINRHKGSNATIGGSLVTL